MFYILRKQRQKVAIKTQKQKETILEYARQHKTIKSSDLLDVLNVGEQRVRKLLLEMVSEGTLIPEGANRNRTYRLKS